MPAKYRPRRPLSRNGSNELTAVNLRLARKKWGALKPYCVQNLKTYSREFGFSIVAGDLILLDNGWYVTHTGLIRLAQRRHCGGIDVMTVAELSTATASRWAFKATVYKSPRCRGFVGYGDADPPNVSSLVHGAEMRVAETRAVHRALRKAYGIGLCSGEELGWAPRPRQRSRRGLAARHQSVILRRKSPSRTPIGLYALPDIWTCLVSALQIPLIRSNRTKLPAQRGRARCG